MRNAYGNFVGNPERKSQLGRPRYRWEDKRKGKAIPIIDRGDP
jgi:hypothetical protein